MQSYVNINEISCIISYERARRNFSFLSNLQSQCQVCTACCTLSYNIMIGDRTILSAVFLFIRFRYKFVTQTWIILVSIGTHSGIWQAFGAEKGFIIIIEGIIMKEKNTTNTIMYCLSFWNYTTYHIIQI
jgi:hypothetical protein